MSKFSHSEILDIRRRLEAGEYQHAIAAVYGVNQGRISEIKNGKKLRKSTGKDALTAEILS